MVNPNAELGYKFNLGDRKDTTQVKYGSASDDFEYDVVDKGCYYIKAGLTFRRRNVSCSVDYKFTEGRHTRDKRLNFNLSFSF